MPEYGPYLRGFGINKGLILGGYELKSYRITHEVVKMYREYNYDTTLNFVVVDNNHDVDQLLSQLEKQTKRSRVISSQFGNPYRCWFGQPKIIKHSKHYSKVQILCLGYAKRINIKKSGSKRSN